MKTQNSKFIINTVLIKFLFFLPIIIYSYIIIKLSVNIPIWDDYESILSYLVDDIPIFSQHNEHRIAFTRIISLISYQLTSGINFTYIIYFGNSALLVLLYYLLKQIKNTQISLIALLPIPYFLFQFQAWENMTWAMASIQNNFVVLFALLSLIYWNKKTVPCRYLAILFGIFATFTSGNGMLVLFILIIWEISIIFSSKQTGQHKTISKYYIHSFILFSIVALIIYLYFYNYHKSAHHPNIFETLKNPFQIIQYSGLLVGSFMKLAHPKIAFWTGILEIVLFIYLTYIKYYKKNPVIYLFMLYVFLSLALIAISRSGIGNTHAFTSRYMTLSALIPILLYISFLDYYKKSNQIKSPIIIIVFFCSLLINYFSYNKYMDALNSRKDMLIIGVKNWNKTKDGLYYHNQKRSTLLIIKSEQMEIYKFPKFDPAETQQ